MADVVTVRQQYPKGELLCRVRNAVRSADSDQPHNKQDAADQGGNDCRHQIPQRQARNPEAWVNRAVCQEGGDVMGCNPYPRGQRNHTNYQDEFVNFHVVSPFSSKEVIRG